MKSSSEENYCEDPSGSGAFLTEADVSDAPEDQDDKDQEEPSRATGTNATVDGSEEEGTVGTLQVEEGEHDQESLADEVMTRTAGVLEKLERLQRIQALYGAGLWSSHEAAGEDDEQDDTDSGACNEGGSAEADAGNNEEVQEDEEDDDNESENAQLTREILARAGAGSEVLQALDDTFALRGGEDEEGDEEEEGSRCSAAYDKELRDLEAKKSSLEEELAQLGERLFAHSERMKATMQYEPLLDDASTAPPDGEDRDKVAPKVASGSVDMEGRAQHGESKGEEYISHELAANAGGNCASAPVSATMRDVTQDDDDDDNDDDDEWGEGREPQTADEMDSFIASMMKKHEAHAAKGPKGPWQITPQVNKSEVEGAMDHIEGRLAYLMEMQMKLTSASNTVRGMISNLTDDFIAEMRADGVDIDADTFDPDNAPLSQAELFLKEMEERGLYKPPTDEMEEEDRDQEGILTMASE